MNKPRHQNPTRGQETHSREPGPSGDRKESTKRRVYIEPGAQIDIVRDLREEYRASQASTAVSNKRQFYLLLLSTLLLFTYTGLTASQAYSAHRALREALQASRTANKTFQLGLRPWISPIKPPEPDGS